MEGGRIMNDIVENINDRQRQRYIVSTNFWHDYFKDFLDDKHIKYEVSWSEQNMGNKIVTTQINDKERKDITMFLRFPRHVQKEVEQNDK